jgi:hypothetical protein
MNAIRLSDLQEMLALPLQAAYAEAQSLLDMELDESRLDVSAESLEVSSPGNPQAISEASPKPATLAPLAMPGYPEAQASGAPPAIAPSTGQASTPTRASAPISASPAYPEAEAAAAPSPAALPLQSGGRADAPLRHAIPLAKANAATASPASAAALAGRASVDAGKPSPRAETLKAPASSIPQPAPQALPPESSLASPRASIKPAVAFDAPLADAAASAMTRAPASQAPAAGGPARAWLIPLRPKAAPTLQTLPAEASEAAAPADPALAERLGQALAPSFEQAYAVTQDALASRSAPDTAHPEAGSPSRVSNTFNVRVAMNAPDAAQALDAAALEDAMVEVLRQAARRHGLEL